MTERHVVTCFLRNRGKILLLRRSDAVGSYRGKWGGVAGHVEDGPERAALREIAEETRLADDITLVRAGEPFPVEDETLQKRWIVHPFLFDCERRELHLDWESTDAEWVPPTEILHRDTVPDLWTSYARVAPTVETVVNDLEHDSAYLSLRALEVLRDRAARLVREGTPSAAAWRELVSTAVRILRGRPATSAVVNRLHRVMHRARQSRSAESVERAATAVIEQSLADEDETARRAARYAAGGRIATLSRSGTLVEALAQAEPRPRTVVVMESRPGGEGVDLAEALALRGLSVTLVPDTAIASLFAKGSIDRVMIGADVLLPSGDVVGKVGSLGVALAARQSGIPFFVLSTTDHLQRQEVSVPPRGSEPLYQGDAPVRSFAPVRDVVPAELVTELVTEEGVVTSPRLQAVLSDLEALTVWGGDSG